MGIRDKPIVPGLPWQNGFAERLIGSIRRECVDHVIVLGEPHLRRILTKYAAYYNELRTQRSLGKDAPIHRAIQHKGRIASVPSSVAFTTIIVEFSFRHRQAERTRTISLEIMPESAAGDAAPEIPSFTHRIDRPCENTTCQTRLSHDVMFLRRGEGRVTQQVFDTLHIAGILT